MTKPQYDQDFWEQLWSKTLSEHADKVIAPAAAGAGVDAVIRARRRTIAGPQGTSH